MAEAIGTWGAALRELGQHVRGGGGDRRWRVHGLKGGARAYFLHRFLVATPRPALIVLATAKEAERLTADLRFFFGEDDTQPPFERRIHYLPSWEVAPFEDLSPAAEVVAARIEGLYHLSQSANPIVVTTAEALVQRVPPRAAFAQRYTYLVEGDEVDRDHLARQLTDWGYRHLPLVEDRGELSVRGGIVDIFPPAHANPLRLELSGDTIEALHEFDPVSQRLLERRPELLVLPVREFDLATAQQRDILRAIEMRTLDLDLAQDERNLIVDGLRNGLLFPGVEFCLPYCYPGLDTVFDYLPAGTVVWIDEPGAVDAALEGAWTDVERRAAERAAEHRFYPPPERLYLTPNEWRAALAPLSLIHI